MQDHRTCFHRDPFCIVLLQNKTLLFMVCISKFMILIIKEHFCANVTPSSSCLTLQLFIVMKQQECNRTPVLHSQYLVYLNIHILYPTQDVSEYGIHHKQWKNHLLKVRSEVLTVMTLKITNFWDMTQEPQSRRKHNSPKH